MELRSDVGFWGNRDANIVGSYLRVPAEWLELLGSGDVYLVKHEFLKAVVIYPSQEFEFLLDGLEDGPIYQAMGVDKLSKYYQSGMKATIRDGGVAIPSDCLELIGCEESDVALCMGHGNRFEVWSVENWNYEPEFESENMNDREWALFSHKIAL